MSYAIVFTCRGVELTSAPFRTLQAASASFSDLMDANPGVPDTAFRVIEVVDPTIAFIHLRADYEELRGKTLRALNAEIVQLSNVEIALSRDVPKVEISLAVVRVAVDALTRLSERLGSKHM